MDNSKMPVNVICMSWIVGDNQSARKEPTQGERCKPYTERSYEVRMQTAVSSCHLNISNQDYVHVSEIAHFKKRINTFPCRVLKKWFGLCENQDRRALQLLIIVSKILLID